MSIHITTVRQHLLDTLADLRRADKPMEVARARAVAEVAGVLVDTARVEIDYLRATQGSRAGFLEAVSALPPAPPADPGQADPPAPAVQLPPATPFDGLTGAVAGVTRHVLKG
jgi:hypothetical protein